MSLDITIVDGVFNYAGQSYTQIMVSDGPWSKIISPNMSIKQTYTAVNQAPGYDYPDNTILVADEQQDYHKDYSHRTKSWTFKSQEYDNWREHKGLCWKFTLPDNKDIFVEPTNDVDLNVHFTDCSGNKCRYDVDRCRDHWCEGCHGFSWYDVFDVFYGMPKTWGQLLRSPLRICRDNDNEDEH